MLDRILVIRLADLLDKTAILSTTFRFASIYFFSICVDYSCCQVIRGGFVVEIKKE